MNRLQLQRRLQYLQLLNQNISFVDMGSAFHSRSNIGYGTKDKEDSQNGHTESLLDEEMRLRNQLLSMGRQNGKSNEISESRNGKGHNSQGSKANGLFTTLWKSATSMTERTGGAIDMNGDEASLFDSEMESEVTDGTAAAASPVSTSKSQHRKLLHQISQMEEEEDERQYCERWEDMVAEVNSFFEWCVANKLNKVQWLLLGNYLWDNHLHTRQHRLSLLVELGHKYSVIVGGNSPLGNVQQHGWFMADTRLSYTQQVQQIKRRVDWVFEAGFDFLTTESGSSEFTHPECNLMLDLLNIYADYVANKWGREAGVKVHCSTGQVIAILTLLAIGICYFDCGIT